MIYFDNAATTFPKPQCVLDAVNDCAKDFCVNAGRGQYSLSAKANKLIEETRQKMKKLFHCNNDFECIFTDSATTALNTILQGLDLRENVYITPFEHNAVLRTLYEKCHTDSIFLTKNQVNVSSLEDRDLCDNIKELSFDVSSFSYDLEKIESQFKENPPDFLMMSHASNTFGFVVPIEEISRLAKKINSSCVVILDCAQTAGLFDIDFSTNLFDFAVFAGHKTLYSIFGVAGFVMRKSVSLKTFIFGGTGTESANPKMPDSIPEKYEAGSHNIIAVSSLNASLDEIEKQGRENLLQSEIEKRQSFLQILRKHKNIKIIGDLIDICDFDTSTKLSDHKINHPKFAPIVSCVFENYSADEIGSVLNEKNIAVRTGLHCAPNGHKILGTFPSGTVRFSLGRFTNEEDFVELDKVLEWIEENS